MTSPDGRRCISAATGAHGRGSGPVLFVPKTFNQAAARVLPEYCPSATRVPYASVGKDVEIVEPSDVEVHPMLKVVESGRRHRRAILPGQHKIETLFDLVQVENV